ncbi:hypothetical protein LAZ67_21000244 [Cordylochernes scorpioides]|uniref:L-glutamate gamma-semialdehyde dehydrogenase n=1 Tax=Cordylochernes scorpioides TaxID=51811 RepID=A0ABY6LNL2_9ARAC|nr:hypothetical protein LAZ67_21000244 [Cordylochernes scorpioides]
MQPFDHSKEIAKYYWATPELVQKAIDTALAAREEWERVPLQRKVEMFLKAGDLVSTKYRMELNAATMLGQGKTAIQAEIDSAAELADFFRFNAYFAKELTKYQPISQHPSTNTFRLRGLEVSSPVKLPCCTALDECCLVCSIQGFIASISPFNFTAIGGNLASAPALMGNVVVWKPSDTAILSNYIILQLLKEAGFPPGVVSFVPADGPVFGGVVTASPQLAGINFTGSVPTFQWLWKQTAQKLEQYKNFPRLVGECGGKNYHFVHPSADIDSVVALTIRSAFEYSGQKCSACSRAYIPDSIWPKVREGLVEAQKQLKLGSPLEWDTFLTAVIDKKSHDRISSYLQMAKSPGCKVLAGGSADGSRGYYVQPTVVEVSDPGHRMVQEEIFGPVLSVVVYSHKDPVAALRLVRECNYGLTGAIFAQDP